MRKQRRRSAVQPVTAQLISAFVFTAQIVQFLLYLYSKFQDSIFPVRLYRLVCVRPGQKSRRPVFLHHGSYLFFYFVQNLGTFGPLKCREIYALDKLQKQTDVIESLVTIAKSGSELDLHSGMLLRLQVCTALRHTLKRGALS